MSVRARLLAALAAVLVIAVVALALALPRIAASDAVRARLVEAVEEATRRDFSVAEISAGLFPPHLMLREPSLAGDAEGPSAAARSAELRLAVLPLLARVVVVRSLVVESGSLHLERGESGLRLVGTDLPELPKEASTDASKAERSESDGFSLAVKRVTFRDSSIRLDDRTREPAPRLELREVALEIEGTTPGAPVDVELEAALASGGTLSLAGQGRREGPFEAKLELREVALVPFAAYAVDVELPARVGGTFEISGKTARPDRLKLALEIPNRFRVGGLEARGPLSLRADLAGDLREPEGSFELDATQGELALGSGFRKPAGVIATATGSLRRKRAQGASMLRLEGVDLMLGRIAARAELELAPRREIRLDAAPFEAAALRELIPALERRELAGKVGFTGLRIELEPLAVYGSLTLDPLVWNAEPDAPIELRGALEGRGDTLEGRDLRLALAGQTAPLTLRISDLAKGPRFLAAAKLEDADSGALVAAFGGSRERLSGPLDLDARLAGPLTGDAALAEALEGDVAMRIAPGRLKKVSLLRAAFAVAGGVQRARGKDKDDGALHKYGGDEFESLSGRFRIANGSARTEDLRLVYSGYTAELRGSVGIADRALDLRGTLLISPELDRALGTGSGRGRTVPLARVTGTLDAPAVELSREALAGVAAAYAGDERRREKWEHKLDERLGEGEGKEVLKALDKVLESLREPPEAEPEPAD